MRACLLALALSVATASTASSSTVAATASLVVTVDGIQSDAVAIALQQDGSFRDVLNFVACDGSVRLSDIVSCDGSVTPSPIQVALRGSIFPFIAANLSFTDAGTPSSIVMSLFLPIAAISGISTWSLDGTVALDPFRPGGATTPLPGSDYFSGLIGGGPLQTVASLGSGPVSADPLLPVSQGFGPVTGNFDCDAVGGCTAISLVMGATGLGGGHRLVLSSTSDVNAAPVAPPVPLPATSLLLLAGLAGFAAMRRRAG